MRCGSWFSSGKRRKRRYAVAALQSMGGNAVPALPDLRRALEDPANEPMRKQLESAIKTLDNYRVFRARNRTQ